MFGKNKIMKQDLTADELQVVSGSPFLTIQGEGPYTGRPAVFVRLHGCNLRCWFCDTEFSDPSDEFVGALELADRVVGVAGQTRLVVITGGEPLRQNILPLCRALVRLGFTIQVESSGSLWIPGLELLAQVVVSPKTGKLHPDAQRYARAFKYVISADDDVQQGVPITATQPCTVARPLARPFHPTTPIYYSPMDEYDEAKNARNRARVAELAIAHGGIAGLQLHKFLGVD